MVPTYILPSLLFFHATNGLTMVPRQNQLSTPVNTTITTGLTQVPRFQSVQDVESFLATNRRIRYINYLYAVSSRDRKLPEDEKEAGKPVTACGFPGNPGFEKVTAYLCHGDASDWPEPYPVTFEDAQYYEVVSRYRAGLKNGGIEPVYPSPTRDGFPLPANELTTPQFNGTIYKVSDYHKSTLLSYEVNPFFNGFIARRFGFDIHGYMYQWVMPSKADEGWRMDYDFNSCRAPPKYDFGLPIIVTQSDMDHIRNSPGKTMSLLNCTVTSIRSKVTAKMELPAPPAPR